MQLLLEVIDLILNLLTWIIIISAILSWLVAFNVINTRNQFVYQVGSTLYAITEPLLRPIRRVLPLMSGVDLSPIVALIIIWVLRRALWLYIAPALLS